MLEPRERRLPIRHRKKIDTNRISGETIKVPFPHPVAVGGVATPEPITLEVVSRPSFRNPPSASAASLAGIGLFGRQDGKTHRSEPLEAMILPPKNSSSQRRCRRLRSQYAPPPARFCRRVFRLERSGKFCLSEADCKPKKKAGMYPARRWLSVFAISQRSCVPERHSDRPRRRPSM